MKGECLQTPCRSRVTCSSNQRAHATPATFTTLLGPAPPLGQKLPPSCCFILSNCHCPIRCVSLRLLTHRLCPGWQAPRGEGFLSVLLAATFHHLVGRRCSAMCQMHESALFLGAPRAQGSPFLLERVMWSVSPALTVQSQDWDFNHITFMPGFASFFRWGLQPQA